MEKLISSRFLGKCLFILPARAGIFNVASSSVSVSDMGGIIILVSLELRTGPFQRHFRWHIISGWEEFTGTLEIMARGDLCTSRRRLYHFISFLFYQMSHL